MLGSDDIGVLGKLGGELRVGVEGPLDALGDSPAGAAELSAPCERGRKPGTEDKRQSEGLGHEWRDRADRPSDGSTSRVVLVLGRGADGVVGGGELVLDDGELGLPAVGEIGRGRRIFQGLAQGVLASGQGIAQHAKVLAR